MASHVATPPVSVTFLIAVTKAARGRKGLPWFPVEGYTVHGVAGVCEAHTFLQSGSRGANSEAQLNFSFSFRPIYYPRPSLRLGKVFLPQLAYPR